MPHDWDFHKVFQFGCCPVGALFSHFPLRLFAAGYQDILCICKWQLVLIFREPPLGLYSRHLLPATVTLCVRSNSTSQQPPNCTNGVPTMVSPTALCLPPARRCPQTKRVCLQASPVSRNTLGCTAKPGGWVCRTPRPMPSARPWPCLGWLPSWLAWEPERSRAMPPPSMLRRSELARVFPIETRIEPLQHPCKPLRGVSCSGHLVP